MATLAGNFGRMRMDPGRCLSALACIAATLLTAVANHAWAAPDCASWNTEEFFKSAGVADVRRCLVAGESLHHRDVLGRTPLHVAAEVGRGEQVSALLELGAATDALDENGATPLHSAARNGTGGTVAVLVGAGADVDATDERGVTPLHIAAREGTPDSIRDLLAAGARVYSDGGSVGTPLHEAASREDTQGLAMLLAAGADPNAADSGGQTPLHKAAAWGTAEVVVALLEEGADPNARDEHDETPLMCVSGDDDFEKVAVMLEHGADPIARSSIGQTPLHQIATLGSSEAIVALLEAGAPVDARDDLGQTPLMLARQSEQLSEGLGYDLDNSEAIEALLEAGAEEQAVDGSGQLPFDPLAAAGEALNAAGPDLLDEMPPANCEQWTEEVFFVLFTSEDIVRCISDGVDTEGALLRASKVGGAEQVKALVAAGADVNERNISAQTPLHVAVEPLHPAFSMIWPILARGAPMSEWHQARVSATIAALLAAGADLEARDDAGQTPLHVAASGGTSLLAQIVPLELFGIAGADESADSESRALAATVALLAAGADVEAQDDGGRTPLHQAASGGSPEIIGAILETGTRVDPVDGEGRTPLHLATAMLAERPGNVSVLVNAGAATDVGDKSGETPLHIAAKSPGITEISALVVAGASVNSRNNSGRTPLHLAARHGDSKVIEALIEAGADPEARDDYGRTPSLTLQLEPLSNPSSR